MENEAVFRRLDDKSFSVTTQCVHYVNDVRVVSETSKQNYFMSNFDKIADRHHEDGYKCIYKFDIE